MAEMAARRHALGLPEGSVRTLLTMLVVTLTCLLLLVPSNDSIPLYLVLLLLLVVGHFFAPHGPGSYPLHVPVFILRVLIMGAIIATIVFRLVNDKEGLEKLMKKSLDEASQHLYLPLLLLGGFFIGLIFRMIVGRDHPSAFLQDLEAWLALIAVLGLLIAGFIHLVINPSLEENSPIGLTGLGGFLAVVVAFYFGARS